MQPAFLSAQNNKPARSGWACRPVSCALRVAGAASAVIRSCSRPVH